MDIEPKRNAFIELAVIIPVYNEEAIINNSINVINSTAKTFGEDYEIIFVNDGSSDNTRYLLEKAAKENEKIMIINFSRNFGHQMAFTAGLDYAKGDAVIVIDGDLQDPPEIIPNLLKEWENGHQIILAQKDTSDENLIKHF